MLPYERKERILAELESGIQHIEVLAEMLDVSEITVRRDLKSLEDLGKVERLHGGVARLVDTSKETPMDRREGLFSSEKENISQYAANRVDDGDVIFIDSGSTNMKMLKYLSGKKVTIITNGYKNIEEAMKYNLDITLIGGELKKETYAFVGATTLKIIDFYNFDKCFLGVNGIDLEFGLSNADPNESVIKEKVITRSKKSFIVTDHSKFHTLSVFKFGEIEDATIITDQIPDDFKKFSNIVSVGAE